MKKQKKHSSIINAIFRPVHEICKHLKNTNSVLVAFSGGLDSTVLLHAVCRIAPEYNIQVEAVYVNHGIRSLKEQQQELEHVRHICNRLQLFLHEFQINDLNLRSRETERSLEELAREERYACFQRAAAACNSSTLFLAHHLDDQVETILFQFLRSGSLQAMTAMRGVRVLSGNLRVYRPFLPIKRSQLSNYAGEQGLQWMEDSTNSNTDYTRNYLRHTLIPAIAQRFPGYRRTILRCSQEARELLSESNISTDNTAIPMLTWDENEHGLKIPLQDFCSLGEVARLQVLRSACKHMQKYPTSRIIAVNITVVEQKTSAEKGAEKGTERSRTTFSEFPEQSSKAFFRPLLTTSYQDMRSMSAMGKKSILKGKNVRFALFSDYLLCLRLEQNAISGYFFYIRSQNVQLCMQYSGCHKQWAESAASAGTLDARVQQSGAILRSPAPGDQIMTQLGYRSISGILKNIAPQYRELVPLVEDSLGISAVFTSVFGGRQYRRPSRAGEDAVLRIHTKYVNID